MVIVSELAHGKMHFHKQRLTTRRIYPAFYIPEGEAFEASSMAVDIFYQYFSNNSFSLFHCIVHVHEDSVLSVQSVDEYWSCQLIYKSHLTGKSNGKTFKYLQGQVLLGEKKLTEHSFYLKAGCVYEMLAIPIPPEWLLPLAKARHLISKPVWGHYKMLESFEKVMKAPNKDGLPKELFEWVVRTVTGNTAKEWPISERQVDNLFYVQEQMKLDLHKKAGLKAWASQAQMNLTTFKYLFNQVFGVTPYNYLLEMRLEAAKKMAVEEPDLSLAAIAERCGFITYKNLHRLFYTKEKMTLTAWKKLQRLLQMLIASDVLDTCWL
ncbi:AraC family transcriptional regulator [Asinibacterium sp. OR53]|uniref:helix-turn-helix domain-containing protein n=1 Tax=Asinibacterium sp. OR53 TaxID=925409 RepID=UPI00047A0452|nr:AraC family transcriptional regulator [Asinibacterium sp. OR53]